MRGYAKTQLLGNAVRDAEVRTTTSGKTVASFTLAVNTSGDEASYFRCVAWDKTAEIIGKFVTKGKPMVVHGDTVIRPFEKDGVKRESTEVTVREFYFLSTGKTDGPIAQHEVLEKVRDDVPTEIEDKPIDLSEIPF